MKNRRTLLGILVLGAAYLSACGQGEQTSPHGSGGAGGTTSASGGSGGKSGSGGSSTSSGGGAGSGGAGGTTSASGGSGGKSGSGGSSTSSGGGAGSGGTSVGSGGGSGVATGGVATGGGAGSGGASGTGGGAGSGGASGTGGAAGSGGSSGSGGNTGTAAGGRGAGGGGATGGGAGTAGNGAGGAAGAAGTGGGQPAGGSTGSGGSGPGGSAGGGSGAGGGGAGGGTGGLPPLTVNGTKLQDPNGKTIVLRGSSLIDIGALYAYGSNSAKGITDRMDKVAAAGVQGHVVRLPVYPKIDYNLGGSYCSPLPYPVGGTGSGASCSAATSGTLNAADYVSKVLKPAVDYATGKNLYVIIDHHQIDNVATGNSAADATTFWTDVAPKFASYTNVIFEAFNEPIDSSASWATLKPIVQGWIDTIRKGAPNNIIIVPSMSYDQHTGDAASNPPTGTNLMFTAHVYPGNWNTTFQNQVTTAAGKAPVFMTEWGYQINGSDQNLNTTSSAWGTSLESFADTNGLSWTAWIDDNGWTPPIFSDSNLTSLTDFGTLVKNWLAAKASSDWVQ